MKNRNKFKQGFALLPILLVILAFVIAGAGAYAYYNAKQIAAPQASIYQQATTTQAVFSTSVTSGTAPLQVTFSNIVGNCSQEEDFYFGDSPSATEPGASNGFNGSWPAGGVTHTYTSPGTYAATLYCSSAPRTALGSAIITVNPPQSSVSVSGTSQYTNAQYGFSLQYPNGVQINTAAAAQQSYTANINNGTQVAVIGPIEKSFTANEPNWGNNGVVDSTGNVTVGVSTNSTDVAQCMTAPTSVEIGPSNIATKNINGVNFLSYDVVDPAAGLLELSHTYTTLHNGICYSIDASISGVESGHLNASDGAANDAVLAQLTAQLDTIAQSFKFTAPAQSVSVPGMSQYTDSDFGFSFWYPSSWAVTQNLYGDYQKIPDGTVVKEFTVSDPAIKYSGVNVLEVYSPTLSITIIDPSGLGLDQKYFFDPGTHTWMSADINGTPKGDPPATTTADVSQNTMGGLHIFTYANPISGDTRIVPLSAQHFLLISPVDSMGGGSNERFFANTIVATDPSVATPVSVVQQTATIQAEAAAYAGQ